MGVNEAVPARQGYEQKATMYIEVTIGGKEEMFNSDVVKAVEEALASYDKPLGDKQVWIKEMVTTPSPGTEFQAREELKRYQLTRDFVLAKKVYDVLVDIADRDCAISFLLKGKDCGNCPVCLIKPLEVEILNESIRASWHNPQDDLETYWQALYAIRCIAEHVDLPGKKANGKRKAAVLAKALSDIDSMREAADVAILAVKGPGR